MSFLHQPSAYSVFDLLNTGVSGELRYFGSASPSARPPNATWRPDASRIGNMSRFRNRLMFPILDASGRHVAFGGRALGDAEPKYLNSPETPVFSKSKTLYALGWCKNDIRKVDRVFVVEGYMDAIRLMIA